MQNLKFKTVILAARIAAEFFQSVCYEKTPEFDELGSMILQKVAHSNKSVRESINEALNAMVSNISPKQSVKVLTSAKGAGLAHCFLYSHTQVY